MSPARVAIAALLGIVASAAACDGDSAVGPSDWTDCQASDQAFVRKVVLAVDGRTPWGQAEVNALADAITDMRIHGASDAEAKEWVTRSLMRDGSFRTRWGEFLLDALLVNREHQLLDHHYKLIKAVECFGEPGADATDDGRLAAWVRDHAPTETDPPALSFSLGTLLGSALELDDVSPLYRANLFSRLHFALPGANVAALELERDRRTDFGGQFESSYLHRDPSCCACHNSESSVTHDADPEKNRWWPLPGNFERALFGDPTAPEDPIVYRSIHRVIDVEAVNGAQPWGWDAQRCGLFSVPNEDDPLGVAAYFGSIHADEGAPWKALRASSWALEAALHRGVDLLADQGLVLDAHQDPDPDAAFAYLVAANFVERVWKDLVGSELTTPNYFPRTQTQRDTLKRLTDSFVRNRFSLKSLVVQVVTDPAFNVASADEGCGRDPYAIPRGVYDAWTDSEEDEAKRGNGPGDAINAIPSRRLARSVSTALGWPTLPNFPLPNDTPFEADIGLFIQNARPGFRGLDFQARLALESRYGACAPPVAGDFIEDLANAAQARSDTTVGDAIVALKDRLIGEAFIDAAEAPLLEDLIGGSLDAAPTPAIEAQLRAACGVYINSPQFMLAGMAAPDGRTVPKLSPPDHDYAATCATLAASFVALDAPWTVHCAEGAITVSRR